MSRQDSLLTRYQAVRTHSTELCAPLEVEDYVVQPISDVSPPKWHLAHTTWFFEELLLVANQADYSRFNPGFGKLFNSYYKAAGEHWLQSERGQLSRPTVAEVLAYRAYVDAEMEALLSASALPAEALNHLEIGLHHEQQHQELLLMDIKYILGANPSLPAYSRTNIEPARPVAESWQTLAAGNYGIGHEACQKGADFAFDNESPRHTVYVPPVKVCDQPVSNQAYLEFIEDGGYQKPEHWLSLGWDWIQSEGVTQPLYWLEQHGERAEFTLHGAVPLDPHAPVSHISYFEAQAFASWAGMRLPTEQELELYLCSHTKAQPTTSTPCLHPVQRGPHSGQLWCWTSSSYAPYPGYRPYAGVLGEYNGKFMCNQQVLRGGCIATPAGHYRHSYRNFYLPHQRWMFSGIRLAKDAN